MNRKNDYQAMGGDGGDGGPGSDIVLNYSNIENNDIENISEIPEVSPNHLPEDEYINFIAKSFSGIQIQEKFIDSKPKKSSAFSSFSFFISRVSIGVGPFEGVETQNFDSIPKKQILIINSGGVSGSVGQPGMGGRGGDGYFCTIGPDQATGKNNTETGKQGVSGKYGKPGKLILNKLD